MKQTKIKLEKALKVFRTKKNTKIIDMMIIETLEKTYGLVKCSTIDDLRISFYNQNFSCWNNILNLDQNKKYY